MTKDKDSREGGFGEAPPAKPAEEKPAQEKPVKYTVAPGRTITTLRGAVGALKPLRAMDFTRGQVALDELVQSGDVIKS